MKHLPPLLIAALLIALLYQCNREPIVQVVTDTSQLDRVRDSASVAASIQRANYEIRLSELKPVRDTLYRTITKWRDRPVITIQDQADSCCEVGFQYMIAYEATSAALAACDTLQRTESFRVETDSTALMDERRAHENTKKTMEKKLVRSERKGNGKGIGGFILGFLTGRAV